MCVCPPIPGISLHNPYYLTSLTSLSLTSLRPLPPPPSHTRPKQKRIWENAQQSTAAHSFYLPEDRQGATVVDRDDKEDDKEAIDDKEVVVAVDLEDMSSASEVSEDDDECDWMEEDQRLNFYPLHCGFQVANQN